MEKGIVSGEANSQSDKLRQQDKQNRQQWDILLERQPKLDCKCLKMLGYFHYGVPFLVGSTNLSVTVPTEPLLIRRNPESADIAAIPPPQR